GPVDLVAIVLLRVVAGGDVDARRRTVVDDAEGKLRRGPQRVEYPHPDAVGRHDARGLARKLLAVQAAVVADHHTLFAGFLALVLYHRREGLRRPPYYVD